MQQNYDDYKFIHNLKRVNFTMLGSKQCVFTTFNPLKYVKRVR